MQIAISATLDGVGGGDSTATNPDRDQNDLAVSYYLSERDRSTEMTQARK